MLPSYPAVLFNEKCWEYFLHSKNCYTLSVPLFELNWVRRLLCMQLRLTESSSIEIEIKKIAVFGSF